jgi:hypothetical protein
MGRGRFAGQAWLASALALLVAVSVPVVGGLAGVAGAAGTYADVVLADAPSGYWRLGETTGTVAADATAYGNAGTYQGGVALGVPGAVQGDPDLAARFDGVDDRVGMGDPANGVLDFGTADFSVEAWITTVVNGEQTVIGKGVSGTSGPRWMITVTDDSGHAGQLRATIHDGTVMRQGYSLSRVDDGTWHHVVVRFDRDTGISFYVDAVASGSLSGAMPGSVSSSGSLQVGKISGYPYFRGDIDEVAVYAHLLAPDRIQAHWGATGSDTTPPAITLTVPAHGSTTSDTTPVFAGIAGTAGGDLSTVTVRVFDAAATPVQTLTATRSATGSYSVEASPALPLGAYTARAEQADVAGNTGTSATNAFTIVAPPASDPVLVGAGDIASCDEIGEDEATAALLDALPEATVFTTGDNVYSSGTPSEFANCYDPTWGRAKSRTFPSPGNHDYATSGAAGYFGYFGAAAGDPSKGYYSYDLGTWHVIVLNDNCTYIGGCEAGSAQEQWLRADLAAHPADCTLAYWHQPRFSSGSTHGSRPSIQPFWQALYEHGADVVLNGHEHHYERFLPQTPDGTLDNAYGITEFVVGTGGYLHYPFGTILANSAARSSDTHGVLELTLHSDGYDWEFLPVAGKTYTDSGSAACHGAPGPPPPPPPSDTTPPVVTLTSPANGSSTSDTTPTFAGVAGTASGDSTAVTVKVFAGTGTSGPLLQTLQATRAGNGSYAVEASLPLALGTYTAQATQSDVAGNTGSSTANTFAVVAPAAYAAVVLGDAPRAYWRLGETSGATAADELAGNPGTYLNGVTLGGPGAIAGDSNAAVRLDGVDDRVSMGDPASGALDFGTGDFSVEVWLKTTLNGERAVIGKRSSTSSAPYWQVTVTDDGSRTGTIRANVFDGAVSRQVYGPSRRVDDGAWHHVVVVFDRDVGITVYVDGVSASTSGAATGSLASGGPFLVGKVTGYGHFSGEIDEVAVYPRLVSAQQVQAHLAAGRG